jgi:cytochrome oxidase Cu insertion factor (SCO1/SenC/PrrC family)
MKRKLTVAGLFVLSAAIIGGAQAPQTPAPPTQAPVELKEGDKAPEFSLPGTDGKTHKLSDYKGKYVVLAWFPKAFTGG